MISQHQVVRVLRDQQNDGPTNMAVDEAIMISVGAGDQPATLRLYRWSPPALSLGYSQPLSDVIIGALQERGWDLVRRPTGGRAILHTDELTYSFCGAPESPIFTGGVLESYRRLSRGLALGLRSLGLQVQARPPQTRAPSDENPVCFEVPSAFELTVVGRKVCGSAQVRRKHAVLQHGTIPLQGDLGRIVEALRFESPSAARQARSRLRTRAATLSELLGRTVSWDEAADAIQQGMLSALEVELVDGEQSESERQIATDLLSKHRSGDWIERA